MLRKYRAAVGGMRRLTDSVYLAFFCFFFKRLLHLFTHCVKMWVKGSDWQLKISPWAQAAYHFFFTAFFFLFLFLFFFFKANKKKGEVNMENGNEPLIWGCLLWLYLDPHPSWPQPKQPKARVSGCYTIQLQSRSRAPRINIIWPESARRCGLFLLRRQPNLLDNTTCC